MNLKSTTWVMLLCAWFVMLAADWFLPWFALPDMLLLMWLALLFALDGVPLWPPLLLISVLADLSVNVGLGFHGLVYGICALPTLLIVRQMRQASGVEQLIVLLGISILAAIAKGILLYVVEGIPMPSGWVVAVGIQMMLWPFARALGEWAMRPYIPREEA